MKPRDNRFSARVSEVFRAGPVARGRPVFRAATTDSPAELLIYDAIGESFWDDGVTAKDVITALAGADGPVRVRINSPGGDVFEGLAIYNALLAHKPGVETVVDGIAASAASVIALAGSTMTMQDASMFMIHNSATIAFGTRHDMTAAAGIMAKIDGQIGAIYAAKTGLDAVTVGAAMDAETWFTSAEALAAGYCDSVVPPPAKREPPSAAPAASIEPVTDRRERRLRAAEALGK